MTDAALPASPSDAEKRAGFMAAASAYVVWGFLPLYLKLLATVDVREVLAQRILWAAPSAFIAVFLMSGWRPGWREIATAFKPSMIGTLVVSALFIFMNLSHIRHHFNKTHAVCRVNDAGCDRIASSAGGQNFGDHWRDMNLEFHGLSDLSLSQIDF